MVRKGFIVAFLLMGIAAWQQDPMATEPAPSALVDPCSSHFNIDTQGVTLIVCPLGDGHSFEHVGAGIDLWVKDYLGNPIQGMPASDIWLIDCDPLGEMVLCGGSGSCDADAATDALGFTTIRNATIAAGGCADGISVVVQGMVVMDQGSACAAPRCVAVSIRSPDLTGDLYVSIADLVTFAQAWPPHPYDGCADLDGDTEVALRDLAYLALHWQHTCE